MHPKYIYSIDAIPGLAAEDRAELEPVGRQFKFRSNDYYNSLIDWNDPNDPLRTLIVPDTSELDEHYGSLDASGELAYTVVRGLQHKYPRTALLLVSKVCAAYCRFCFRKRLFTEANDEVPGDIGEAVAYLAAHHEIESVVLSGGDPMLLSTARLGRILRTLTALDHIKTIRIDTKIPAFNPFRITGDESLLQLLREIMEAGRTRLYLIVQYTHPRELTPESLAALKAIRGVDICILNQMPLLKGINDDPATVAELLSRLATAGVMPYYVFIGRPILGNSRFVLPLRRAWEIYTDALSRCTGLAKTAKLMMSHATGKIEVVGYDDDLIVLRYHHSPDSAEQGKLVFARTRGDESWFDDLRCIEQFDPRGLAAATGVGPSLV